MGGSGWHVVCHPMWPFFLLISCSTWCSQPYSQRDVEELVRQRDIASLSPFYIDLQDEVLRIQAGRVRAVALGQAHVAACPLFQECKLTAMTCMCLVCPHCCAMRFLLPFAGIGGQDEGHVQRAADGHHQAWRSAPAGSHRRWVGCNVDPQGHPVNTVLARWWATLLMSTLCRRGVWHRDPRPVCASCDCP